MSLVTAPPGWTGGASQELVEQSGRQGHFGGVHGVIEAERYDGPNIVLYVTRAIATTAAPGDAAEAEVAQLGHPVASRTVEGNAIVVVASWHDGDVTGSARLVIASSADRISSVKGECYAGAQATPEAVTACSKALTTLDPGIAAADRIAIPAPSTRPAVPQLSTPGPSETHIALPPLHIQQEPDRRPVYVGAALLVIAAAFWWNRRRAANVR